jgi:hypothetical protein
MIVRAKRLVLGRIPLTIMRKTKTWRETGSGGDDDFLTRGDATGHERRRGIC